jgi:hypothetical protein
LYASPMIFRSSLSAIFSNGSNSFMNAQITIRNANSRSFSHQSKSVRAAALFAGSSEWEGVSHPVW